MATLKELAKELKVSVSTVSKALHDSPEISVSTIEKVKELAKKRNYKPNKIALSLKSNKKVYLLKLHSVLLRYYSLVQQTSLCTFQDLQSLNEHLMSLWHIHLLILKQASQKIYLEQIHHP